MTKHRPFLSLRFKAVTLTVLGAIAIGLVLTPALGAGAVWLFKWAFGNADLEGLLASRWSAMPSIVLSMMVAGLAVLLLDLIGIYFRFAWQIVKQVWRETEEK